MKRYYSESDSEGDAKSYTSSSNDPQAQARKKRRGVIEKRRRDRINNSLSELRRLVPSASEKQGCSKLEKAEILQLTVEHLKTLHDNALYTPTTALDSRATGFRECAAEVVRYLVTVEGMSAHEPLTQRLLSHLHNNLTQREKSEEYNMQWRSLQHISSFPNLVSAHQVAAENHQTSVYNNINNARRSHEHLRSGIQAHAPLAALTAAFPFFAPSPFPAFGGLMNQHRPYEIFPPGQSLRNGITTAVKVQKPV